MSVLLGAFKLLMTLVAVGSVDKLGRRPLLLGGVGGMVVALLLLTAAQGGVDVATAAGAAAEGGGSTAAWVSAAALLLYVGCYQVSFGPISWLLVGEIFPLAVSWRCWVPCVGTSATSPHRASPGVPAVPPLPPQTKTGPQPGTGARDHHKFWFKFFCQPRAAQPAGGARHAGHVRRVCSHWRGGGRQHLVQRARD